eukprot:m.59463 g.59463  ORF g.59463 m.59463 type:complete len:792 (-) comp11772_c0_seq2:1918-4293(-)
MPRPKKPSSRRSGMNRTKREKGAHTAVVEATVEVEVDGEQAGANATNSKAKVSANDAAAANTKGHAFSATEIKRAETQPATRGEEDIPALRALQGRFMQKYFPGYGLYTAKIIDVVDQRSVAVVRYEDNDTAEFYLDQVQEHLLPPTFVPPHATKLQGVEKYGCTWPPPAVCSKLVVSGSRQRRVSEAALQQQLMKEMLKLERELSAKERLEAKQRREEAKKAKALQAKAQKQKMEEARLKKEAAAKAKKEKQLKQQKEKERKAAQQPQRRSKAVLEAEPVKLARAKRSAPSTASSFESSSPDDNDSDAVEVPASAPTTPPKKAKTKARSKATRARKMKQQTMSPMASPQKELVRKWNKCSSCEKNHWNTDPCPTEIDVVSRTDTRRWAFSSTQALYNNLKETCKLNKKSEVPSSPSPDVSESKLIQAAYKSIRSKIDITCGADGRYGITGNITKGSMSKVLQYLQKHCELDESAIFLDLGHGMGRPNLHVAALTPRIKYSLGTDCNPELYKQSMLVLKDMTEQFPVLLETPRLFFFDANIQDLKNLSPCTHVYAFNIGMPDDVILHIFELVRHSPTVKYFVIYQHRIANASRLAKIGTIVKQMSVMMPGGCSYEATFVKCHRDEGQTVDSSSLLDMPSPAVVGKLDGTVSRSRIEETDKDLTSAINILESPTLYRAYIDRLGTVGEWETQLAQDLGTRSTRRRHMNTSFFEHSPCLPDVSLGLLRRLCVALGVSTVGGKVELLANIQAYVPVTFSISLFAIGEKYTEAEVEHILDTLLAKPPAQTRLRRS